MLATELKITSRIVKLRDEKLEEKAVKIYCAGVCKIAKKAAKEGKYNISVIYPENMKKSMLRRYFNRRGFSCRFADENMLVWW